MFVGAPPPLLGRDHIIVCCNFSSNYDLQVVNCIWVDVGECDLVFYIQQNHVEIDAEVAVTVFHRLTKNYFKSYMTGVEVFSHVRGKGFR